MQNQVIEHKGIIRKISEKTIEVGIQQQAACSSCTAKNICIEGDPNEKIIEISKYQGTFQIGEYVNVFYKKSLGFRALFLGYIFPVILILTFLIIGIQITENESISGLIALCSLIPYYAILYLLRKKMNNTFSFSISKL